MRLIVDSGPVLQLGQTIASCGLEVSRAAAGDDRLQAVANRLISLGQTIEASTLAALDDEEPPA